MSFQWRKFAYTFFILLSLLTQSAYATILEGNFQSPEVNEAKSKVFNRDHWMYLTLSPSVKTYGFAHNGENDEEYFKALFGKILQEAHVQAYELYEAENYEAYYSFLVLALAVPFHESGVRHFRTNNPILRKRSRGCIDRANKGKLLFSKAGGKYLIRDPELKHKNFVEIFRDETATILPDCSTFSEGDRLVQLLSSGFQEDMGLFQLNFTHHPSPFLDRDIFDLTKTIRYGLNFLYQGYKKLLFTYNKHECLKEDNGHLDFYNLNRGIWGGRYNSGSFSKTCRFRNGTGFWAFNDYEFLKHYEQLLLKGTSSYHKYLTGVEKKALNDLINKFNSFVFKEYDVVTTRLTVRNKPGFNGEKCGLINNTKSEENIRLKAFEVNNGWARISPYNIKKDLTNCHKTFKETVKYYNNNVYVKLEYKGKQLLEEVVAEEENVDEVIKNNDLLTEELEIVLGEHYFSENKENKQSNLHYHVIPGRMKIRPEMNTKTEHCGLFVKSDKIDKVEVISLSEDGNWAQVNIQPDSKFINKSCRDVKKFYMYKTRYLKPVTDLIVKTKQNRVLGAKVHLRPRVSAGTSSNERLDKHSEYIVVNTKTVKNTKWYLLDSFNGHEQSWVKSTDVEEVR